MLNALTSMNGTWIWRGVWQSMGWRCPSVALPVLFLSLLAVAVQAQEVSRRSDFPFIEALHELDSEREKLDQLRNWELSMGPANGLTETEARSFGTLLDLYILQYVGRDGELDRQALVDDLPRLFDTGGKGITTVRIDDEGNLRHDGTAIYIPSYAIFYFTLDSLVPDFFEHLRLSSRAGPRSRSK